MIIKTYTEESSAAALKRIRKEMGGDAVVLKTRQITGPGLKPMVEVTACTEQTTVARASGILSEETSKQSNPVAKTETLTAEPVPAVPKAPKDVPPVKDSAESDVLVEKIRQIDRKLTQLISLGFRADGITRLERFQAIHRQLKEADMPEDFLESFISSVIEDYDETEDLTDFTRKRLVAELGEMMLPSLTFKPGDKLVFVGPAGSGKSSSLGKLAADLVARQKRKVKLLTLDDFKMAAFDEICSYAEILGIDVVDPNNETEPKEDDDTITLIDTPALPADHEKIFPLRAKIDYVGPTHRFAVFSSLTRSRDVFAICKNLKELAPTHLIVTMQDLATCQGTLITAVRSMGLKVAFMADSPGAIGTLKAPDPALLAKNLLDTEVKCETL